MMSKRKQSAERLERVQFSLFLSFSHNQLNAQQQHNFPFKPFEIRRPTN